MVESGFFAVDAFFFIGGFLVAYAFLKETTTELLATYLLRSTNSTSIMRNITTA